jgi:hypothetical protein
MFDQPRVELLFRTLFPKPLRETAQQHAWGDARGSERQKPRLFHKLVGRPFRKKSVKLYVERCTSFVSFIDAGVRVEARDRALDQEPSLGKHDPDFGTRAALRHHEHASLSVTLQVLPQL